MKATDKFSDQPGDARAEQIGGALAVAGEITVIFQHSIHGSGLFRSFFAHCIAGGKYLAPLGRGAGVPILYCREESEIGRIAMRQRLVSNRDPFKTSQERAEGNIQYYCLRRRDRIDRSLLTREGQQALWSDLEPATLAVIIDSLEGFTKTAGKKAASPSASAPLSELLERLTKRGIAVVIFVKAQGNRKEPPAWLDGLTCNMVYVDEDRKDPMQGGARLTFYRDAISELDRAPRRFTWWWKVNDDSKLEFSYRDEHFVEPIPRKQQAQEERFEAIMTLITEGLTQKEIAKRVGVDPSTIYHDTEKLAKRGEIIKGPNGALSLPGSEARLLENPKPPPADGTDDPGNDADESGEEW